MGGKPSTDPGYNIYIHTWFFYVVLEGTCLIFPFILRLFIMASFSKPQPCKCNSFLVYFGRPRRQTRTKTYNPVYNTAHCPMVIPCKMENGLSPSCITPAIQDLVKLNTVYGFIREARASVVDSLFNSFLIFMSLTVCSRFFLKTGCPMSQQKAYSPAEGSTTC